MLSDEFGVSGWAIPEKIAKGETDAEAMVELAIGALRKKRH